MARSVNVRKKGVSVPHKILSDRGVRLEHAYQTGENSNINHGQTVVIERKEDGNHVIVKIGSKCPKCKMRVRGLNHVEGNHHRGITPQRRSRRR